jgi:hypothetical protein
MARDVLAVSVSGVGVERTFNMARDVCHYRRAKLTSDSVKHVMIIKHRQRAHLNPIYEPATQEDCLMPDIVEDDRQDESTERAIEEEIIAQIEESDEEHLQAHEYDYLDSDDLILRQGAGSEEQGYVPEGRHVMENRDVEVCSYSD